MHCAQYNNMKQKIYINDNKNDGKGRNKTILSCQSGRRVMILFLSPSLSVPCLWFQFLLVILVPNCLARSEQEQERED